MPVVLLQMPRSTLRAALIALGGIVACAVQAESLTIAAYPAVDSLAKAAASEWKKKHPDVELKIISRSFADHHTAMTTALSTSSNLPDVMVLEVGYVARFAENAGLQDLSQAPYNLKSYQDKFVSYAFKQASAHSGAVVAVPADIGPGTLLYRSDLLKKTGLSEAQLTSSWESYVQAGVQLKAQTGAYLVAHARDIKDIIIRSNLQAGEGLYLDSKGKVLINSPRFQRAFELARLVRSQKLDAKVNAWSTEWSEGFKRSQIATQMSGAWLAGHLSNWIAPQTKGLWRAAQLPERSWASWGGSFYAIPKASPNKNLAWDFIAMMTLQADMQLKAFKAEDAFPALLEVHKDPFLDQPIEFLGGQKARLLWREAAQKTQAIDVHKLDPIAEEIVNTELDKVLDQGKDIHTALQDAQALLERRARR